MTVFLVYQTTPLLGGVRPICCFKSKHSADEYCRKCNMTGDGFKTMEVNLYGDDTRGLYPGIRGWH